eukprot:TRINITY_DN1770_c0_g1_i2.p2 TRINITY_DN1770_c0_g1~~TRINITY_DN1770_c0_g1_i2.p2  ORF type:complete len:498 (-),score=83.63 TRINITY_DN1770_c0_g1_i2:3434-4927(-)
MGPSSVLVEQCIAKLFQPLHQDCVPEPSGALPLHFGPQFCQDLLLDVTCERARVKRHLVFPLNQEKHFGENECNFASLAQQTCFHTLLFCEFLGPVCHQQLFMRQAARWWRFHSRWACFTPPTATRGAIAGVAVLKPTTPACMMSSSGSSSNENGTVYLDRNREPYKFTNELIHERSPYLLQHAHNPVNWLPWGEKAFKQSKDENKPIFLSVGYSSCHWCHVMEHESFEDEVTAKIMNANFVNIKVDREERPDVDKIYMTFVQATTGSGGWPMSVFLTPGLEPFYGGTYFPPTDRYGMPSFKTLLIQLMKMWKEKPEILQSRASELVKALRTGMNESLVASDKEFSTEEIDGVMDTIFKIFSKRFDSKLGGFGSAPKFPRPSEMDILITIHSKAKSQEQQEKLLKMVHFTLRKMSLGGIYDHLGGGFHRYSVDEFWHVPQYACCCCCFSLVTFPVALRRCCTIMRSFFTPLQPLTDWRKTNFSDQLQVKLQIICEGI